MSGRLHLWFTQVTPLRQNCAVVSDPETRRAIVTDPGGDASRLFDEIRVRGLVVDAILLTHGHADHVCGAAALRDALAAAQGAAVPVLGPGIEDAFLLAEAAETGRAFGIPDAGPIVPDRYLAGGDDLDLLGRRIAVRAVPGHTPGHLVFVALDDRLAVAGDTLFRGVIGRTDFAYGDGRALVASIRSELMSLPDDTSVLPGHGLPTTIGAERRNNPYLQDPDII